MPGFEGQGVCRLPTPGQREKDLAQIEALLSRAEELDPGYRERYWDTYMRSLGLNDLTSCEMGEVKAMIQQDIHILLREVEG